MMHSNHPIFIILVGFIIGGVIALVIEIWKNINNGGHDGFISF